MSRDTPVNASPPPPPPPNAAKQVRVDADAALIAAESLRELDFSISYLAGY
jgi:hypothetical protein